MSRTTKHVPKFLEQPALFHSHATARESVPRLGIFNDPAAYIKLDKSNGSNLFRLNKKIGGIGKNDRNHTNWKTEQNFDIR